MSRLFQKPYLPSQGVILDANAVGVGEQFCLGVENLELGSYELRTRPGLRQLGTTIPINTDETPLASAVIRNPATNDKIFVVFTDKDVWKLTSSSFTSCKDAGVTITGKGITMWHLSEYTDETLGATLIACGSHPPADPLDSETDGADRLMLYWDQATSTFKNLTQYMKMEEIAGAIQSTDADMSVVLVSTDVPALQNIRTGTATIFWWGGGIQSNQKFVLTGSAGTSPVENFKDKAAVPQIYATLNRNTGVLAFADPGVNWPTNEDGVVFDPTLLDGAATVYFTYDATLAIKPRFVFNMNSRLVMVNTYEQSPDGAGGWGTGTYEPWRVRWGEQQDCTRHDYDSDWIDQIAGDVSPYMDGCYVGDNLLLLRQETAELLGYVGGSDVFTIRSLGPGGTFCHRTAAGIGGTAVWLGRDEVYVLNGMTPQPIAETRVKDYLFMNLDASNMRNTLGFAQPGARRYWLCFPAAGDTSNRPMRALVFDPSREAWMMYKFGKGLTSASLFSESSAPSWAVQTGTWQNATGPWNVAGQKKHDLVALTFVDTVAPINPVAVFDPQLASDFGTAISWELVTRDFIGENFEQMDRWEGMAIEGTGPAMTLYNSGDYGQNWSVGSTVNTNAGIDRYYYWFDSVKRRVRFKLQGSGATTIRFLQPFHVRSARW